jgi:hypothetical protein
MTSTPTPGAPGGQGLPLRSPEAVRQDTRRAISVVLAVAASLVALVIVAGLLVAGYVFHHVGIHSSGKNVEISTPAGSVSVGGGIADTGLPIYTGATSRADNQSATVEFQGKDGKHAGLAVSHVHTPDSIEKVEAWYREKLPSSFEEKTGTGGATGHHYAGADVGSAEFTFENEHGQGTDVVALKRAGSGTDIDLVKAGEQEPQ